MYLENINTSNDVKKLTSDQLTILATEMRSALIKKASMVGGHLASNLGVVELTIAMHYVFDFPKDEIVYDVAHQTYCHKMLTGRSNAFLDESLYHSVTGYTNPDESESDLFATGHSSVSISLACGLAKARDLKKEKKNIIAFIGDSAMDGGQAFEGLNMAGSMSSGIIIVINDNNYSIAENYGALASHLNTLRINNGIVKDNLFKSLGFDYHFVNNGHDIGTLIKEFNTVKDINHPVIIHVCTKKGKGYKIAENDPENWHWAYPFDIKTGQWKTSRNNENYGKISHQYILNKMKVDSNVVLVTAATMFCIGFDTLNRRKEAGEQYIDVGIAEQNAVSIATGLCKAGMKPIFATHSTFYQRAYDQIEEEMCINHIPVTMILTHGSIFGHKNDTHIGLLDIALYGNVPGLTYLSPTNKQEYIAMLDWSINQQKYPVLIRVPWNGVYEAKHEVALEYNETKYQITQKGNKVAIIALGDFYQLGEKVATLLEREYAIKPTLINPRFISGTDTEMLETLKKYHNLVVTLEDGYTSGGFGSKIAQYYSSYEMKVLNKGFDLEMPREFSADEMIRKNKLEPEQIVDDIVKILKDNK